MTDKLTELLHTGAERMPASPPPPADVRHVAEQGRRIRRGVLGGVVAGVLILALAIGTGLLAKPLSTWLAPADRSTTPSPNATETGLFTLAADPVLTVADWARLTSGGDQRVVRTDAKTQPLLACFTDPRGDATFGGSFPAAESYAAGYRQPDLGNISDLGSNARLTEFVLRYGDVAEATQTFADIYQQFGRCSDQTDPAYNVTDIVHGDLPAGIRGPIDEQFSADRGQTPKNAGSGLKPSAYHLVVGRDRNVVVVLESLNGWNDRPSWMLEQAMEQAIPSERGRCVIGPLDCR